MDKKIEKDIIKCSRCGLCADVCPVYKVKHTETALLRGKLLQLLGVIRGDLKWNKCLKASIDYCLACEKCKTQCPSGISPTAIFEKIKSENLTVLEKILNTYFVFNVKILLLKLLYRVKHPVKSMVRGKKRDVEKYPKKLLHFNGCLSKCTNPDFWLPYEFTCGVFECCGLPLKTKGNLDGYSVLAQKNIRNINKTDGLVVFNCATCLAAVKSYTFNDPKTLDKLVFYTELYKDFLKNHKITSKKPVTVTFHHPCHLESAGISLSYIEEIICKIENVKYVRLENPLDCCGFGGDFFTRHPRTANTLSLKKIDDVLKTGADIVLTACPTCLWSLKHGLKCRKIKGVKAYDMAEFLYSLDFTKKAEVGE